MRGIHCLEILFGVSLELRFIDILDFSKFFLPVNASVGSCQSHLWPTSPFNIFTLFILFLFYICFDFIIC